MRVFLLAGLLMFSPVLAYADAKVAGYWIADLGDNVTIEMNIEPESQWNSETAQDKKPIAQMGGYYKQTDLTATSGTIVFTPTHSQVTAQHGSPTVERDLYKLTDNGETLELTASGDTMEFHKLTK